jgi:hypothetical protein
LIGQPLATAVDPERLLCGYLQLIPVLWMLGLNLPIGFLVVFAAFVLSVGSGFAWSYALPWFLVGTMQSVSVLTNWFASDQAWWMLGKHMFASYVSGWFLLGAAIGIGASGRLRPEKLLRSVHILTLCTGLLLIPVILLALALPNESLYLVTPFGRLVPESLPSRSYSFGMFLYNWDEIVGVRLPRVALFYPWPTALGLAGVCAVFVIGTGQPSAKRNWGLVCGVLMTLASLGRGAVGSLLLCAAARWFLDWPHRLRIAGLCTAVSVFAGIWLWLGSPQQVLATLGDVIERSRPGASGARNEVIDANWRGFREAPWIGHGWPREAVQETESVYGTAQSMMVVGSHSTFSGLLYKGGAITFAIFLIAFLRTASGLIRPHNSALTKSALVILLAVALACASEGLESLAFPTLFAFLWLGAGLVQSRRRVGEVA